MLLVNKRSVGASLSGTHVVLGEDRQAEEGPHIGQSLELSATARAQRGGAPEGQGRHLYTQRPDKGHTLDRHTDTHTQYL